MYFHSIWGIGRAIDIGVIDWPLATETTQGLWLRAEKCTIKLIKVLYNLLSSGSACKSVQYIIIQYNIQQDISIHN